MHRYAYVAKDPDGKTQTGLIEASSTDEASSSIRGMGLVLISLHEQGEEKKATSFLEKFERTVDKVSSFILRKVSLVEKMMFTRHLSVMIQSGLSLNQALEALVSQTENPRLKAIILRLNTDIRRGKSFSDSLADNPKTFSKLYVSMVKVGETSGNLSDVLKILAEQMRKDHELISRVRGAMMYPAVIIIAMIGIGILMMIKVVPQLTKVFTELNVELPRSTQIVLAVSSFMQEHFILGTIIIIAAIIAIKMILKIKIVKKGVNRLCLHLPIFGALTMKINLARFARTLSSLAESGVAIVEALQITSDTLGNIQYKESLLRSARQIRKGKHLSATFLEKENLYPPMVVQMVKVGEETGNLSQILCNMAEFYEEEIENITKNMASIIEPIIMIIIGGVVGFFAVSMLQPMYSIMEGI